MARRIEVFADITCPFTHVGLNRVVAQLETLDREVELVVRAWPLEWVNGVPLDADAVSMKVGVLTEQLGVQDFSGFRADTWPSTTIPALNLEAAAFEVSAETGLQVSLAIRAALFTEGQDVSSPDVLARIAERFGLDAPSTEVHPRVQADYHEGQRRGVRGSPDFWAGSQEFFCPSLAL
ncbi:MAG: disulfide bond formation protein DsbA, partial [Acidimicrobiales bacterium]